MNRDKTDHEVARDADSNICVHPCSSVVPGPIQTRFLSNEESRTKPVVVLDTNIVLDWLVFEDGGMPSLMQAIRERRLVIATNQACVDELVRVLAYPAFSQDAAQQAAALAIYCDMTTVFGERASLYAQVPRCRDRDDQKFLNLAAHAGAVALFSKDHAVLGLRRSMKARFNCDVMGPKEAEGWVTTVVSQRG